MRKIATRRQIGHMKPVRMKTRGARNANTSIILATTVFLYSICLIIVYDFDLRHHSV